jgi:hypothetical protein
MVFEVCWVSSLVKTGEDAYTDMYMPAEGEVIDPENPDPNDISLEMIATGLSTEFRYGGHTDPRVTVAQHAVNASEIGGALDYGTNEQLCLLHHDSSEAFTGDMSKPMKPHIEGFEAYEDEWQNAVWDYLGLPVPDRETYDRMKSVDLAIYRFEVETLFPEVHREEALSGIPDQDLAVEVSDLIDFDTSIDESRRRFIDRHEDIVTSI